MVLIAGIERQLSGVVPKMKSAVTCIGASLACSLFVLTRRLPDCKILPGLRCAHAPGCRVTRQTILACHSGRTSRVWPGEGEPEPSDQSGSCIHAGRGLLGPGSRE